MSGKRSSDTEVIHRVLNHPGLAEAMRAYYQRQFSRTDRAAHARRWAANRPTDLEYAVPVQLPGTRPTEYDFPFQHDNADFVATVSVDRVGQTIKIYRINGDRKQMVYFVTRRANGGSAITLKRLHRIIAPPRTRLFVFQSIMALVRRFMPEVDPRQAVMDDGMSLKEYMQQLKAHASQN